MKNMLLVSTVRAPARTLVISEKALSDDIVGAFPAWAKAQPQYADLPLDNIVVVTLPQPMCTAAILHEVRMRLIGLAVLLTLGLVLAPLAAGAEPTGRVYRIGILGTKPRTLASLIDQLSSRSSLAGRRTCIPDTISLDRDDAIGDRQDDVVIVSVVVQAAAPVLVRRARVR